MQSTKLLLILNKNTCALFWIGLQAQFEAEPHQDSLAINLRSHYKAYQSSPVLKLGELTSQYVNLYN